MASFTQTVLRLFHDTAVEIKDYTGYDASLLLAALFSSVTLLLIFTRFTTGNSPSGKPPGSSGAPPSLPYWLPLLGHWPQWTSSYDSLLEENRKAFGSGMCTLNLAGEKHHIISSPKILRDIQTSSEASLQDVDPKKRIWHNVFGVPKSQLGLYHELVSALQIPTSFHLDAALDFQKPNGTRNILQRLQGNIPDLISFNASLIDQEPWEKVSNVKVSEDRALAEVSLLPLVFLFLTHMTTDTCISENLLTDQDHLETGPLLLAFVQSYSLLMSGLPRWIPHPTLPATHIVRRKLLRHLDALLDTTEDAELQNDLLTARARMLDDHKTPRSIRTIELLRLLHGMNAPHVFAFWTLLHVISDTEILAQVREEVRKVVTIEQERPVMGFTVPPRITINASALLGSKTGLLQSCWLESVRLYGRGQASWTASTEMEIDGDDGGVFKTKDKWEIKKGDWIDAPLWHSNTDPARWEDPYVWDPERHASTVEGADPSTAAQVQQDPYLFGLNEAAPQARLFGLAFIASAVSLYDFEADREKGIPKAKFAAGVALPDSDVRIRVRKRQS